MVLHLTHNHYVMGSNLVLDTYVIFLKCSKIRKMTWTGATSWLQNMLVTQLKKNSKNKCNLGDKLATGKGCHPKLLTNGDKLAMTPSCCPTSFSKKRRWKSVATSWLRKFIVTIF